MIGASIDERAEKATTKVDPTKPPTFLKIVNKLSKVGANFITPFIIALNASEKAAFNCGRF
jgi:hypothetical protein